MWRRPARGRRRRPVGHIHGSYLDDTTDLGKGYYKKIELEITAASPCKIVGVTRRMQTLPDHDVSPAHLQRDDPVDPNRSRPVGDDQRWVITDAPGFYSQQIIEAKTYHKRFTVTVTVEDGGETQTYTFEYEVRVEVNAIGGLVRPE